MRGFREILAVLVLVAGTGMATAQTESRLTVSGEGSAFAVPDMAVITMGAGAEAETAKAAMDETSRITSAILDRLNEFEIEPRDIQTSDLSLGPIWSNRSGTDGRSEIEGYRASNQVTVRVRDLDRLGGVLDAVLQDGANTLNGLSFTISDPDPLRDAARRMAVADARDRAALLAEAAGVELGPLVSLSETGSPSPRPEMFAAARMADGNVPVAQGETELRAGVTLVYEISTP